MIPLISDTQNKQIHRDRTHNSFQELGVGRDDNNESLHRILLWEDVEFLDMGSSDDFTTM